MDFQSTRKNNFDFEQVPKLNKRKSYQQQARESGLVIREVNEIENEIIEDDANLREEKLFLIRKKFQGMNTL